LPEQARSLDFKIIIFILAVLITDFTEIHIANKFFIHVRARLLLSFIAPYIT